MAGMKFTATISGFAFDYGGWTKAFEDYFRKQIRLAAAAWLERVTQGWPTLTGFSKGAFGVLGDLVNVKISVLGELKRLHDLKRHLEAKNAAREFRSDVVGPEHEGFTPGTKGQKGRRTKEGLEHTPIKGKRDRLPGLIIPETKQPKREKSPGIKPEGFIGQNPNKRFYHDQEEIDAAREAERERKYLEKIHHIEEKIKRLTAKVRGSRGYLESKLGLKAFAESARQQAKVIGGNRLGGNPIKGYRYPGKKELFASPKSYQKLISSQYALKATTLAFEHYKQLQVATAIKRSMKEVLAAKKAGITGVTGRTTALTQRQARKELVKLAHEFLATGKHGHLFQRVEIKKYETIHTKPVFTYNTYYYPFRGAKFRILKTKDSGRQYSRPITEKDIFTEAKETEGALKPPIIETKHPTQLSKDFSPPQFTEGNNITARQLIPQSMQEFLKDILREKKITTKFGFNFGVNIRYISVIDSRLGEAFARANRAFVNYMNRVKKNHKKIEDFILTNHTVTYDGATIPTKRQITKT